MNKVALSKLQTTWAKKLQDSGFQDLEGPDRDAPLSNRGKLHDADDDEAALAVRVVHGEAYTDWAQDVLHQLGGHAPGSRRRREIWERHAGGESMKSIARSMDLGFHPVRDTVLAIEERYKRWRRPKSVKMLVRRADPKLLAGLAAVLLAAAGPRRRRTTRAS